MFEKFTNDNYSDLKLKDFRTIRHKKKEIYNNDEEEIIEELELTELDSPSEISPKTQGKELSKRIKLDHSQDHG